MGRDKSSRDLGVLILMGIHSPPRNKMYWIYDDWLGVPGINKVMPLKKFKKLLEYVHLCDNDNLPDPANVNMDQLFKVRKLVDMANKTFLAKYKPAREISIDEAMLGRPNASWSSCGVLCDFKLKAKFLSIKY